MSYMTYQSANFFYFCCRGKTPSDMLRSAAGLFLYPVFAILCDGRFQPQSKIHRSGNVRKQKPPLDAL